MRNRAVPPLIALAVAALVGLASWGTGAAPATPPTPAPLAGEPGAGSSHAGHGGGTDGAGLELWAVQTGSLGVVVKDGAGALIYRFDRDGNNPPLSTCTNDCVASWEPLKADLDNPPVLLGVNEDQIDVLIRPDGIDQLTLAGWPLYRHLGSHADPDAQANGTDGAWFAIRPDGSKAS